jgi:hypothetical protein
MEGIHAVAVDIVIEHKDVWVGVLKGRPNIALMLLLGSSARAKQQRMRGTPMGRR